MNHRDGLLSVSLPLGRWFGTYVRVSLLFPLAILTICLRLNDWRLGLVISGILFASVLLHEFGHVIAARLTGGHGNEILLWPLGGLAYVQPAASLSSQVITVLGGPLVNLALCAITAWPVYEQGQLGAALNPFQLPGTADELLAPDDLVPNLLLLTVWLNWVSFLLNLIPVMPLDGGRILRSLIAAKFGSQTATEAGIRVGLIAGGLAMLLGLLFPQELVVFFGALVVINSLIESFQVRMGESYDDSFMGYDFSEGYTSLERSEGRVRERPPGFFRRWRERRRAEKERRQQQQAAEAEQELDALLEKVHTLGLQALTDAERRKLNRASARYRDKGKPQDQH